MQAYHNDPKIKAKYIARMKKHMAADELIHGIGWEDGKGCAVGCTLDRYNHVAYETELGIPASIAYLEDGIFEGMSGERAKTFPLAFLEAVPVGVDLKMVMPRFMHWLLVDPVAGVINYAGNDNAVAEAINNVAALFAEWISGTKPSDERWVAASDSASDAARDAWVAAWDRQANKLLELLQKA